MTKIAIIGAGISGLSAANLLKDHADITIFEKARGVGGRISTRRAGAYCFDHGAQYFTVRTKAFQNFIQPLIDGGTVKRWNARYVKFDGDQIIERQNWSDDEPRYVGVPNMDNIAQQLAEGLNIKIKTRIISLRHEKKWHLFDEDGKFHEDFDWVISTAPSPQAAELFPRNFKYHAEIKAVEMSACCSLMLGFFESLPLEFDAAHFKNTDLNWLAVNSRKPFRADLFTLMVHSSAKYAAAHIDDDREDIMRHLCAETSRILGYDVSTANYKTVHCWRYANNAKREDCPILIDQDLKLAACGDWCLGGRVEGAFTSAYNLVKTMKESFL